MRICRRFLIIAHCVTPALALATIVGGCTPPKPAPLAPTALHSTHRPADVAQIAARELAAANFELTTSDATNGLVVGRRTSAAAELGDAISCNFKPGSPYASATQTTFTLTVSARPASDGSDIQITSRVHADYTNVPPIFGKRLPSDTDCASSGIVERRIADAIK
jgi:hypothetical protein